MATCSGKQPVGPRSSAAEAAASHWLSMSDAAWSRTAPLQRFRRGAARASETLRRPAWPLSEGPFDRPVIGVDGPIDVDGLIDAGSRCERWLSATDRIEPMTGPFAAFGEVVVCDPAAPACVVAEAQLSGAPPARIARLVLDLGHAHPEAAALARNLATGVLVRLEALLADPATDLPAHLRDALAALAAALSEQTPREATVTVLDTPRTRAWRAHPAGRGR
jgi:hypothetical protein